MATKVENKPVVVPHKQQAEKVVSPKNQGENIGRAKREPGIVKFYHRLKRYGVIIADQDEVEFLVLQSDIKSYKSYGLEDGERVEFVAGLGREEKKMALEVTRGPMCFTCEKEGHIARNCLRRSRTTQPKRNQGEGNGSGGGSSGKGACYNCGKPGHIQRNCPEPPQGVTPGDGDGATERACYNCGKAGHLKANCSEPRQAINGSCYVCGETGHFKRDCPNNQQPTS